MIGVMKYRCKHPIEAMRWIDTDANREAFCDWFTSHDELFMTRGSVIHEVGGLNVVEGQWVLRADDEWYVMDDEQFHDMYYAAEG